MIAIWAELHPGEVTAIAAHPAPEGWQIVDVAIERPGRPSTVGDTHRGRVLAHLPAMAGSFVALADGSEAFLPDSAAPPGLSAGDAIQAQITRAPQGGKGPRLGTATRSPPGPPALLSRGPGAVARLAALHPAAPVHIADPALFAACRPTLADRLDRAPLPPGLTEALDALSQPEALLPGGTVARFHPTPALVAVDLDTASATGPSGTKSSTQFAANRAALPALARQIRARNLSGAILVDFAGLSPKRRAALGPALAEALAADPATPRLLGFTALGLAEIVRTRTHPPLHELRSGPHAAALQAARHLAREPAAAVPILRAAPDVHAALATDPATLSDLAAALGRPPIYHLDPALPPGAWLIEDTRRAPTPL